MAASKLALYNAALSHLGEARLASLTDAVESRRTLDDHFDNTCRVCLESGMWNFATRAIEANDDPAVEPTFGYQYAFKIPNDWMRTTAVYSDVNEREPLVDYAFEQGYFYANLTPIYIRFVSSDPQYGMDLGKWSESFRELVEAHLAWKAAPRISNNAQKTELLGKLVHQMLLGAENKNAMDLPARFPPLGTWTRSRLTGFRGSRLGGTGRGL